MATEEKPKLVAIVDDDELIRDALDGLMKAAGFSALAFASAEEFLNSGEQQHIALSDRRHPYAGDVRIGTPIKTKRGPLQDSNHFHYGTR